MFAKDFGHSSHLALSIDVEDWFHSENVKAAVPADWSSCESRVERNTMRILEILDEHSQHATFFVLGWVAERFPGLVRAIAGAGHEVASHGHHHELVYQLTPARFRDDIIRSKSLLEDLSGRPVSGYRAPCFSITEWAIPILRECGFRYDSSMVPTLAHDRYGKVAGLRATRPIFPLGDGFHEICVSCRPCGASGIPWGGGGYFRLIPYAVWRQGMRAILSGGLPYVFYIHPWDMDPGQPRMTGLHWTNRFRQRVGLARCEDRFEHLVGEFDWLTMEGLLERWVEDQPDTAASMMVSPQTGIAA